MYITLVVFHSFSPCFAGTFFCPYGGIGRRAGLRNQSLNRGVGSTPTMDTCDCGGTGRHEGLKIPCRKACRFESCQSHIWRESGMDEELVLKTSGCNRFSEFDSPSLRPSRVLELVSPFLDIT